MPSMVKIVRPAGKFVPTAPAVCEELGDEPEAVEVVALVAFEHLTSDAM